MTLAGLLVGIEALLLDFDGPMCAVFSTLPAEVAARHLLDLLPPRCRTLETDPLAVLRYAETCAPTQVSLIEETLRDFECEAVAGAVETPGLRELVRAAQSASLKLAVVSNNSEAAVHEFLRRRGLTTDIETVCARSHSNTRLLKPHPHLVIKATHDLKVSASESVLVGDSETDVTAARSAGVPCVGYANKPGKLERLMSAGAAAVVESLEALTRAIPDAANTS